MQPTLSKTAWFNTFLVFPLAAASSNYGFHYSSQFSSTPLLPLPYKKLSVLSQPFLHALKPYQPRPSSLIGLKKASHLLFAAYCRAKEKNKAKTGVIPKKKSEVDANEVYLYSSSEDSNLNINSLSSSSKNDNND